MAKAPHATRNVKKNGKHLLKISVMIPEGARLRKNEPFSSAKNIQRECKQLSLLL